MELPWRWFEDPSWTEWLNIRSNLRFIFFEIWMENESITLFRIKGWLKKNAIISCRIGHWLCYPLDWLCYQLDYWPLLSVRFWYSQDRWKNKRQRKRLLLKRKKRMSILWATMPITYGTLLGRKLTYDLDGPISRGIKYAVIPEMVTLSR